MLAPEVALALAPLPGLAELLRFILVRDVRRRPSIPEILRRRGHPPWREHIDQTQPLLGRSV